MTYLTTVYCTVHTNVTRKQNFHAQTVETNNWTTTRSKT